MPRFTCNFCGAGYYSAAVAADLNSMNCDKCGSLLVPADEPIIHRVADERLGHLIARREVTRAQVQIDAERVTTG